MLGSHRSSGHHCYKYYHRHSSREGRGGPSRCRRPRRDIAVANRFFLKVRLAPFVFAFGRARSTISSDPCHATALTALFLFLSKPNRESVLPFLATVAKRRRGDPIDFCNCGAPLENPLSRIWPSFCRVWNESFAISFRSFLRFSFPRNVRSLSVFRFGLSLSSPPPRDHFQSSMLYLWSRFNGMDFLGEWLIRSSSNLNETTSQRFPR